MKIVYPSFYKDFKCIAGECPDSCCQGWEVDADSDSLDYYKTLPDSLEIKQRIDRVLDKDEFGNTIFSLAEKKRCPFLNSENLCDMHIAIGGEHTPFTCRTFPRFIYDFGGTREIGVSFSCPVASDMMYNLGEHMTFSSHTTDELPTLNDIDAQLYFELCAARKKAYSILQDDTKPLPDRLCDLLDLGIGLQSELNPYTEGDDGIDLFDVFRNPELINPQWQDKVNHHTVKAVETSFSNENIAMYFVYKYLLQAVYDSDPLSKIKMAVVGVLVNTYFGESSWTIHLWSKETEHSQYNMDRYKNLLRTAHCLSASELKKRLNIR